MSDTGSVITIRDVSKTFADRKIIEDFNLEVKKGTFVSFVGPSGCGKSTLLRLIAGLEYPDHGSIEILNNSEISIGFVFQEPNLLPWKTVYENVSLPLEIGPQSSKHSSLDLKNKIMTALERVHLANSEKLFPHQLSGGMKMRVSLARSLITNPSLILMDEPFSALDEKTRFEMQDLLLDLWSTEKKTILFVTHSLYEAAYLSQRIVFLDRDKLKIVRDDDVRFLSPRNKYLRTSAEFNSYLRDCII